MSERKAVIKNADMTQELQEDAVDVAARVRLPLGRIFSVTSLLSDMQGPICCPCA